MIIFSGWLFFSTMSLFKDELLYELNLRPRVRDVCGSSWWSIGFALWGHYLHNQGLCERLIHFWKQIKDAGDV